MRRRLTRHPGIVLLLMALLLTPFVAACGASGDDDPGVATLDDSGDEDDDAEGSDGADPASSDEDLEEQALEFAQCMRENGVPDFPDPQVDGGRIIMGGPGGETGELDQEAVEKAMKVCEDLRPSGGGNFSEEDRQEMQDAALEHAQCMRENGVPDFPDPEFSDDGARIQLGDDIDPESPAFKQAQEACEDEMPNRPGDDG
jgi:hypothetical protein